MELAQNELIADESTLCDGNCGVDAFAISVLDMASRTPSLARSPMIKKLRLIEDRQRRCHFLRGIAQEAMRKHVDAVMWEDYTFGQLCVLMDGRGFPYAEVVRRTGNSGAWVDASILHCLAISFGVDVAVWQEGLDPALLGKSLQAPHSQPALCVVAMVNDVHFWGVTKAPTAAAGQILEPRQKVVVSLVVQ
jgi:hypothetical protein